MKKKALIVTVGTGTRPDVFIVKPLVKMIRRNRPDFLALIATDESHRFAEAVTKELGLAAEDFSITVMRDYDDFEAVFRDINDVFDDLLSLGFNRDEMQIDFTSGTKAMSSGAVLSAVYQQCESVTYITGERRNGVVIDGSERFLDIQPTVVFSLHDMRLAESFIRQLRFSSALAMLMTVNEHALRGREKERLASLKDLCRGYMAWDAFNHKDAFQKFKKAFSPTACFPDLHPTLDATDTLHELSKKDEGNQYLFMIDLYNNSQRRAVEGRYDDAVARLYRLVEMLGQAILKTSFGIDSGRVDLSLVPVEMRDELGSMKARDGEIKIGLERDYRLLAALGHPVGLAYLADETLQGRLKERNQSILAHGEKPMTESIFTALAGSVASLISLEINDFPLKAQQLQFPWLRNAS